MKDIHNLMLNQIEEKYKEIKIGVLRDTKMTTTPSARRPFFARWFKIDSTSIFPENCLNLIS